MSLYIRSFRDDFRAQVLSRPDAVVMVDAATGIEISWHDLDVLLCRLGGWLADRGLKPGDTLLCLLPNSVEALALFLACLRYGYSYAPLPPSASTREIQQLRNLISPGLAVVLADAEGRVAHVLEGLSVQIATLDLEFGWAPGPDTDLGPREPQSGRLYISTSGSTGEPKVMVINGDKLWSAGHAFVSQYAFLGPDSRFYNIMPMSYLGGLFNLGLIPLACGGSTLVSPAFSGSTILRFWQEVMRYEVTILWLVPTMIRSLIQVIGPRWKSVATDSLKVRASFLGTAPIDLEEKLTFERIFGVPLLENYGLSETTFLSAETMDSRFMRGQRSVGEALPWVEMRLVAVGDDLDPSGPPRIEVRTPFLFEGYFGGEDNFQPIDPEAWFDTGDLGHLNGSQLILDGRIRDVIKKGGVLIHLAEIETLVRQVPGVVDVATIDTPHSFYGEDYVLFVTFESVAPGSEGEHLDRMRAYLTDNLVQNKWPAHIIHLAAIPRTRSGKVARSELRAYVNVG